MDYDNLRYCKATYVKSKRIERWKENIVMIKKTMQLNDFLQVIMHRDEWDDESEEPASAGAPLTTKEKDLLRYYYYIHNGIDTRFQIVHFSSKRCHCR